MTARPREALEVGQWANNSTTYPSRGEVFGRSVGTNAGNGPGDPAMAPSPRSGRITGEQLPLDLGLGPPVGQCAWCRQPIRRGEGVTVERPYGFGLCMLSLQRGLRGLA